VAPPRAIETYQPAPQGPLMMRMSPLSAGACIVPGVFALVAWLLYFVPGLAGAYGAFIDEHYYVACAKRLAWGYVDHPPLGPVILRLAMTIADDSLAVLRAVASTFGALAVFGTGLLAARLGAGRFGQGMASAALLAAPIAQVLFGFFSMNAVEPALWLALCWLLIELADEQRPALWVAVGVVAGLALMNKHTVATFAAALGIAMLLTPARRQLMSRWPFVAAAVAGLIVAPNILWQVQHGWPSLEFYRNAALYKNQPAGPLRIVTMQVLFVSPGTLPVWLAGLVLFLRRGARIDLRHVGLVYVVLMVMLIASRQSRPDRLLGMYPVLFAAGGLALDELARSRRWIRIAAPAWLTFFAILLAPIGVPLLPPRILGPYAQALGLVPQLERGAGKRAELPQWFADRLGWEQLVEDVATVRDALPPNDRSRVIYFAPSYGQAGALEWLGASRTPEPVYSTHNNYFFWGPPPTNPHVAIVIGDNRERLLEIFEEVSLAKRHECDGCMPWRDQMPIWVVRRPKVRIADEWPSWRHFE
jgi:hypothetical protein